MTTGTVDRQACPACFYVDITAGGISGDRRCVRLQYVDIASRSRRIDNRCLRRQGASQRTKRRRRQSKVVGDHRSGSEGDHPPRNEGRRAGPDIHGPERQIEIVASTGSRQARRAPCYGRVDGERTARSLHVGRATTTDGLRQNQRTVVRDVQATGAVCRQRADLGIQGIRVVNPEPRPVQRQGGPDDGGRRIREDCVRPSIDTHSRRAVQVVQREVPAVLRDVYSTSGRRSCERPVTVDVEWIGGAAPYARRAQNYLSAGNRRRPQVVVRDCSNRSEVHSPGDVDRAATQIQRASPVRREQIRGAARQVRGERQVSVGGHGHHASAALRIDQCRGPLIGDPDSRVGTCSVAGEIERHGVGHEPLCARAAPHP